jgi:hypothetical protein
MPSLVSIVLALGIVGIYLQSAMPPLARSLGDAEMRQLFVYVSKEVDQYRSEHCRQLPVSVTVAAVYAHTGKSPPPGVSSWNVLFPGGWAVVEITGLGVEDRAALMSVFDSDYNGGVLSVAAPTITARPLRQTAYFSDRIIFESDSERLSYGCKQV